MTLAPAGGRRGSRLAALRVPLSFQLTRYRIAIALLTLLAFVLRVAYIISTHGFAPQHDAHHYDLDALYIANEHRYPPLFAPNGTSIPNAYRPPVYEVFLAVIYKANYLLGGSGTSRWATARVVEAAIGAIAVAALALIARRLWGRRVSLVTAAIAAIFPPIIFVAESLYSEALFVPLVVFATAAIVEYRYRRKWWILILAGVLTGLAALTREYGAVLVIPFCVALRPRDGWTRNSLAPITVLIACTFVIVIPWTIRNAVVLHAFVPVSTSTGNTIAGTYNSVSRDARHDPAAWRDPSKIPDFRRIYAIAHQNQAKMNSSLESAAFAFIGRHPAYPFVVAYWNTVRMLELAGFHRSEATAHYIGVPPGDTDVGIYVLWLLLLLAIGGCFTPQVRSGPKWVWLIPVLMYLSVVFTQSETPRFRSPIDPFLVMLASIALVNVWDLAARRFSAPVTSLRRGAPAAGSGL